MFIEQACFQSFLKNVRTVPKHSSGLYSIRVPSCYDRYKVTVQLRAAEGGFGEIPARGVGRLCFGLKY